MNRQNNSQELIVSGIHLELTPSLKIYAREKTARLFRHESHIIRIRVELECESKQAVASRFIAKGHVELNRADLNAAVESDELHKSIDLLVDKLDRMLRKRACAHKVKRNHPQAVELATLLPKIA